MSYIVGQFGVRGAATIQINATFAFISQKNSRQYLLHSGRLLPQLRKIHPLDFPIEVFLADLTTRPANIIRAELAGFASCAGTGTFDIEPPFTVRHLCMFSRSEMRRWPNFGRKCLNEVEEMLRARGLQLWENHDERSLRLLREHKEYFK